MKNKSKIKKIINNDYFKFLLCIIIFYVFIVALNPGILEVSYLHAEDGRDFFGAWVTDGVRSLLFTQGGYLCLVSRIIGGIAFLVFNLSNSIYIIGDTIEIMSTIFSAIVFAWFCSKEFDFLIKERYKRIVISIILILLFSNYYSVLYNAVGIHWVCGYVSFLAGLKIFNNQLPSFKSLPIILISIISSASSMILGFSLIYYVVKNIKITDIVGSLKKHTIYEYIKFCLIGLFMCVQAYFILFVGGNTSAEVSNSIFSIITYSVEMLLSIPVCVFGPQFLITITKLGLNVYLGSSIWIFVILVAIRKNKLKYIILFSFDIFFLYFMTFYKNTDLVQTYQNLTEWAISFYNALPSMIFMMLVLISFDEPNLKNTLNYNIGLVLILSILFYILAKNIYKPDLNKNAHFDEISSSVNIKSKYYTLVEITPYNGWAVKIPVNKKYCEVNACDERNNY